MPDKRDKPDNSNPVGLHGVTREINSLRADLAAEGYERKRLFFLLEEVEAVCQAGLADNQNASVNLLLQHRDALIFALGYAQDRAKRPSAAELEATYGPLLDAPPDQPVEFPPPA